MPTHWPEKYLGALVVDVGHSLIRAGYSGEVYPSQLCYSAVGVDDDVRVFPVIPTVNSKFSHVEHLKYYDRHFKRSVINKESYLRALRGILGDRAYDRAMIERLKKTQKNGSLEEIKLMAGAHRHVKDCWDNFSQYTYPAADVDKLPNLEDMPRSKVLRNLHTFDGASTGFGEIIGSRPLFVVESNQVTTRKRLMETEILFEDLGVPGLYFGHGSKLACYSFGLFSSLVIDIGSATTSVAAISDDELLDFKEFRVGGDMVDAIMLSLMNKSDETIVSHILYNPEYNLGISSVFKTGERESLEIANRIRSSRMRFKTFMIQQDLRSLKEQTMRVSPFPLILKSDGTENTTLPDGEAYECPEEGTKLRAHTKARGNGLTIPLDTKTIRNLEVAEAFQVVALSCEFLFNPGFAYMPKDMSVGSFKGLVPAIEELLRNNMLYKKDVMNQVTLIGGQTGVFGFQTRLATEIGRGIAKTPQESPLSGLRFKFVPFESNMSSRHASWMGGSLLSSLGSFQQCWITRLEYDEHGSNISLRKGGQRREEDI